MLLIVRLLRLYHEHVAVLLWLLSLLGLLLDWLFLAARFTNMFLGAISTAVWLHLILLLVRGG